MGGQGVAIVVLMRDEAASLPALLGCLAGLEPRPDEVVAVDGGSSDGSVAMAAAGGLRVVRCGRRGRAAGINEGVALVSAPIVCVLHADTLLPRDAVGLIREGLAERGVALGGFTCLLRGPGGVRWGTSFHNWVKTWYAPLLFRPVMFWRGLRLLFGDHAMFFRRDDFMRVGGCDETMLVMEDAELCLRLSRVGRVRLLRRRVVTSDRRVARWGGLRANWVFLRVGVSWALGFRRGLAQQYEDVR